MARPPPSYASAGVAARVASRAVRAVRHDALEPADGGIEGQTATLGRVGRAFQGHVREHLEASLDRAARLVQRRAASVLEGLAGREGRRLTHDTGAASRHQGVQRAVGVAYAPLSAEQAHDRIALVDDAHLVGLGLGLG